MRTKPDGDDDLKELERLNAAPWQAALLDLNPSYTCWGPHEDYMWTRGDSGWNSAQHFDSWEAFGPWGLDDLNEIANFYFELGRESTPCTMCNGKGKHPDAQWITESWYRHCSPFTVPDYQEMQGKQILERFGSVFTEPAVGRGAFPDESTIMRYGPEFRAFCEQMRDGDGFWSDKLTQDEVQALVDHNRLYDFTRSHTAEEGWKEKDPPYVPTADEVNRWARGRGMGHDAINAWIATSQRCKRLGVPETCPVCEGHGSIFTAPSAHLDLILWILHPRKGCSRGVEVKNVQESDLPAVFAYLKTAASRNAERFAAVVAVSE